MKTLIQKYNIKTSEKIKSMSLDDIIKEMNYNEFRNREGCVVQFFDNQLVKFKEKQYCIRHKLLTESLNHEHIVIRAVLDEELDDILGMVDGDDPRKAWALEIAKHVSAYVRDFVVKITRIIDENHRLSRKDFAIKFQKYRYFSVLMPSYLKFQEDDFDFYPIIIESLKKHTSRLEIARDWLRDTGFNSKIDI